MMSSIAATFAAIKLQIPIGENLVEKIQQLHFTYVENTHMKIVFFLADQKAAGSMLLTVLQTDIVFNPTCIRHGKR